MSKRRKYDGKNKRSFIIIVVVAIFIVCIFSLFIYKYNKTAKIEYKIESGTVLQDIDRNYVTVDDGDAVLKIGWNDDYYLLYNDEKIVLSDRVVSYNTLTGGMKLYGNFYEILSDGKIVEHKNETVLANTTDAKFYKIDDREYLLVDRKISSKDNSIEAGNYLLVELDKAGNAKLSNDKVNLKTITPTILVTSKYTFDISNELLNFGEYDIDLKKIIGSTNQYVPEEEVDDGKDENDTNDDDNQIGAGIGDGQVGGPGNIVNNNDVGSVPDMDEILDKVKMTSVIRVVEGLTQIDVDYVIYDPYGEYKSVYVEVISSGKIDVVYLSKTDTHLVLNNLSADTSYKLNFIYTSTVTDDTGNSSVVPYTFDQFELKTLKPKYSISINKISKVYNTLTYRVDLEKGFNISKVNVNLSFEYDEINPETSEVTKKNASIDGSVDITNISSGYILGKFDITGYNINADTLLKLTVKSVVASDVEIPINSSSTFRFGR